MKPRSLASFPNRKPRTGGAPGLDHFSIRPGFGADPLQEIEDQGVNRIWHGCDLSSNLRSRPKSLESFSRQRETFDPRHDELRAGAGLAGTGVALGHGGAQVDEHHIDVPTAVSLPVDAAVGP